MQKFSALEHVGRTKSTFCLNNCRQTQQLRSVSEELLPNRNSLMSRKLVAIPKECRRLALGNFCEWCEFTKADNDDQQHCGDDPSAPSCDVGVQWIKDAVFCHEYNEERGRRGIEATVS